MSSVDGNELDGKPKRFWHFIKKGIYFNPLWRAVAEAVVTMLFTFTPFVLLSLPFTVSDGELTQATFRNQFWKFWEGGELILPILATSGALVSAAALNKRAIGDVLIFTAVFVSFFIAAGGWFVLGKTDGFAETIHPQVIWCGFVAYFFVMAFLVLVTMRVYQFNMDAARDRANPEERAVKLNRELAQRRVASFGRGDAR
ncbi:hypothetical protein [Pararhodobacter oceanensis]|uniref:Uncharacterized protein n=1 Tax=Pararhodobacter oceanensis TaxID=2172121 RepID=A0A2T8HP55_9RHOB|nr:hypothetical protein [Pararhodobacter oceanensis]PVH27229.1 hypothetical protein DDE20_18740 [Pararhodobacter oceanensis]